MRKKLIIVLISLIACASIAGIIYNNKNSRVVQEKKIEDTVAVEIYKVENSHIEKYKKFSGIVGAGEKEVVTPKALSNILSIKVKVGDYVKKGQVLMILDSSKLDEQISQLGEANDKLQGTVAQTQTKIDELKEKSNGILLTKGSLEKEIEELENSNLVHDEAIILLESKLESGEIIQEEYDKKKLEVEGLKAINNTKILKDKAEIKTLELTKATLDKSITEFEGILNSSSNNTEISDMLNGLYDKKGNYTVISGISGIVKELNLKVGEMPISFTKPGLLIENNSTVDFEFQVSKEDLDKFKVDMEVKTYVDINGKETEKIAKIESISSKLDERTKQYKIIATFVNNNNEEVKVGSFIKLMLGTEVKKDIITIPKDSIIRELDKNYVYIDVNGVAKKVEVKTGTENHNEIEIKNGLKIGDRVVVKGKEFIKQGEKINIVKEVNLNEDN
ncbi:efflux RND transporter periplasmic adaptor subunit [uncultured Clostridium sp.]|jgi:multidrug efflux pump subunit AcrA (membrane-fusion protein)|uniref:efflux RND transporter periplasmic adaptor subunit n=1 Tax=uncultured Clostridium sp. TaxID=59620 RepID=UPI0026016722|nr:efflux RND transporter periplasmic adaptor subunit [uncultured Clostridium sp.]